MAYLIFLLVAIALFGGFLFLTTIEAKRGTRFFASHRSQLDQEAARILFIVEHVDFAAYAEEEGKRLAERVGHDIAHQSLQAVRTAERQLSRLVRHLRNRQSEANAPREETKREFVKTLADFKGHLEATRPEVPDIHEVH